MGKLVHEQLREWAKCSKYGVRPTVRASKDLLRTGGFGTLDEESKVFQTLADEIERQYIAKPLFEDGSSVQFGDRVDGLDWEVDAITFYDDDVIDILGSGESVEIRSGEFAKIPEVLDANGNPILVGDIVWSIPGCQKGFGFWSERLLVTSVGTNGNITVTTRNLSLDPYTAPSEEFSKGRPIFDADRRITIVGDAVWEIKCEDDSDQWVVSDLDSFTSMVKLEDSKGSRSPKWVKADHIVHREPRTLEGLHLLIRDFSVRSELPYGVREDLADIERYAADLVNKEA